MLPCRYFYSHMWRQCGCKRKKKFCGTNTWRASHLICWRGLSKPHKKGILVVSVTLPEQSNRKSVWCKFCHFPSHCVDRESSPSCPIVVFHGRFSLLVISPPPPGTFGSLACPHRSSSLNSVGTSPQSVFPGLKRSSWKLDYAWLVCIVLRKCVFVIMPVIWYAKCILLLWKVSEELRKWTKSLDCCLFGGRCHNFQRRHASAKSETSSTASFSKMSAPSSHPCQWLLKVTAARNSEMIPRFSLHILTTVVVSPWKTTLKLSV